MFRHCLAVIVLLTACVGVAHAGEETRVLGRATVEYRGDGLRALAAWDYSWLHHAEPWLLIDVGLTSKRASWLTRDDFTLTMPDGLVVDTPSIAEWRRDAVEVIATLARARSVGVPTVGRAFGCRLSMDGSHRNAGDLVRSDRCENGLLWPRRVGTTVRPLAVNDQRAALTKVFFRAPDDAGWPAGDYTLTIHVRDRAVRLPVRLP